MERLKSRSKPTQPLVNYESKYYVPYNTSGITIDNIKTALEFDHTRMEFDVKKYFNDLLQRVHEHKTQIWKKEPRFLLFLDFHDFGISCNKQNFGICFNIHLSICALINMILAISVRFPSNYREFILKMCIQNILTNSIYLEFKWFYTQCLTQ